MKIDLEFPFNDKWKKGYLVINKEPRRNVILYNSHTDRTTISYARYLLSVSLGRILDRNEVVDHINNDKLDDRLDNYQILSPAANVRKSAKGKTYREFVCPVCGTHFKLESRQSHKANPTCSRSCGGKKSHWKKEIASDVSSSLATCSIN